MCVENECVLYVCERERRGIRLRAHHVNIFNVYCCVSFAFWFRFVLSLRTMCIIACLVRQIAEATPDLNVHNKCTSRQRTEFNLFIAISMNFAEIYVNQMVCSLPFSFPFSHFCFRTGHTLSTNNALIMDFWRIAFAVFVCHFDFRERTQRANKIV